MQYYDIFENISISEFDYTNMPLTVDYRSLEKNCFLQGGVAFFYDEELGFLCLPFVNQGVFDGYGNPTKIMVYSLYNNYQRFLEYEEFVIIWNNYKRLPSQPDAREYALRLYNLDRIIDVNSNAQKTPILLLCDEKQRLAMKNIYQQYDGNAPVIIGNKKSFDKDSVTTLTTESPFVSDRIYELKTNLWNEYLTRRGIYNVSINKRERLISDEVTRSQGGVLACRKSFVKPRKDAFDIINAKWGLNIQVEFSRDLEDSYNQKVGDSDE